MLNKEKERRKGGKEEKRKEGKKLKLYLLIIYILY